MIGTNCVYRSPPPALPSKTLVVAAGRDDVLRHPESQDASIAELYGAEYLMLHDAPHCMLLGSSSLVTLDRILDWLRLNPDR